MVQIIPPWLDMDGKSKNPVVAQSMMLDVLASLENKLESQKKEALMPVKELTYQLGER